MCSGPVGLGGCFLSEGPCRGQLEACSGPCTVVGTVTRVPSFSPHNNLERAILREGLCEPHCAFLH